MFEHNNVKQIVMTKVKCLRNVPMSRIINFSHHQIVKQTQAPLGNPTNNSS